MEKKIIINIGRQLGSGGREIARILAEEFGCKLYDKELLNLAAKESGFSEKVFEQNDEQRGFLRSLFHMHAPHISDNNFYKSDFSQESLFQFQSDAIRKAAEKGSCIFVGRCADYVLRDLRNVVNVFVTASLEFRISNVANKQNISRDEALKVIEHGEKARAEYYNYYTGKQWGHATSYDLCIDSSQLGLLDTEKFIAEFVRRRFGIHK
jgi:cytidylate kinase